MPAVVPKVALGFIEIFLMAVKRAVFTALPESCEKTSSKRK